MRRLPSIVPRTAVVFLASLGMGFGLGNLCGRGDSHRAYARQIRAASREANANAGLMCALVDVLRDRHLGAKMLAEDLPHHYLVLAKELHACGRRLNWMPELAVAAFITRGRFVPFALANSHLSEGDLVFSASPSELRSFVRECLRRWAELEGRRMDRASPP